MPADLNIERLYDDHAQALFAFLLNFTRDENDTRDVLQEVYVKLARHPGLLRRARDERAFLIRLAHNAAVDLMRRRAARCVGGSRPLTPPLSGGYLLAMRTGPWGRKVKSVWQWAHHSATRSAGRHAIT